MRDDSKASAADAGEQLPLLGESAATTASRGSNGRARRRVVETTSIPSGADEEALSDFVIFLWFLSHDPEDPRDYAGLKFTVEAAAEHHGRFRERFSLGEPCSDGAKPS